MRRDQIDSGTKRPRWELDSIKTIANEGNFRYTFNLLLYFIDEVNAGRLPDDDVIAFVLKTIISSFSDEKRRTQGRNCKIKSQIERSKSNSTIENAVLEASKDFHLTPERITSIYYGRVSPVSRLSEEINEGREPSNELLTKVANETTKMLAKLIQDSDKGERLRTRLKMKGYKDWYKPTAEHEEITQDIQRHIDAGLNRTQARKLVANESQVGGTSGYTYENIKKIDQRRLKRLKQDVQDLVDSGVPPNDAAAIIAQVSDTHIDKIK